MSLTPTTPEGLIVFQRSALPVFTSTRERTAVRSATRLRMLDNDLSVSRPAERGERVAAGKRLHTKPQGGAGPSVQVKQEARPLAAQGRLGYPSERSYLNRRVEEPVLTVAQFYCDRAKQRTCLTT